jgi:hypothetical protein
LSKYLLAAAVAAFTSISAVPANAAVVIGPTEGSLTTFVDTNTSTEWLRLDNFFNMTPNQMLTVATANGFTLATTTQVHGLLNTLPLGGTNWATYESIMGGAPNRDLIWGFYNDGSGDPYGWAYSFSGESSWSFADNMAPGGTVQNGGSGEADMNVWAFRAYAGGAVPEPGTWTMMLVGFGGIGLAMRRKKKAVALGTPPGIA